MDYYKLHAHPLNGQRLLSNSLINSELDKLEGKPETPGKAENYRFGSLFHSALLEPQKNALAGIGANELSTIMQMVRACFKELGRDFIYSKHAKREHEYFKKMIGHWWKAKIDHKAAKIITDFKTTIALNAQDFEHNAMKFKYDQQCFIYMNITKVDVMQLVGVQKFPPFEVFIIPVYKGDFYYQSGEAKLADAMLKLGLLK
jgi:hypothetical protein